MFKLARRVIWLVVGFVLGLGSSWALMRRLRRFAMRVAPADVAARWSDGARSARRGVRAAVAEGRAAMRAREAELRAQIEPGPRRTA